MSKIPLFSDMKSYTVQTATSTLLSTAVSLGNLALMLYEDESPKNQLTPHKWVAIYLANRELPGWYLDPNMQIEAGTTIQVPAVPPKQYPQLVDGVYYNTAFGYRMKLSNNWNVDEGAGTAVTFKRPGRLVGSIKTAVGGPNLHDLIDELMADLAGDDTWDKTQDQIGMATGMKVMMSGAKNPLWFIAQYIAHKNNYHAFILDFPGKDAGWLGKKFEPFPQFSALQVGQPAKVQTENSVLNMRRVPGLNHEVLQMLPHETVVTIVAPAQTVDGYVWWQVCTEDEVYGWVVEAVDGIKTLIPVG
ncbi:MAG: SH3 domain-containing protein [Chloroflexi bacterium]|nr:MAG: SH3 domain-containing protein [Chloroflexota bacterium]